MVERAAGKKASDKLFSSVEASITVAVFIYALRTAIDQNAQVAVQYNIIISIDKYIHRERETHNVMYYIYKDIHVAYRDSQSYRETEKDTHRYTQKIQAETVRQLSIQIARHRHTKTAAQRNRQAETTERRRDTLTGHVGFQGMF